MVIDGKKLRGTAPKFSGTKGDYLMNINTWTDYLRLITSIKTSLSSDAILSAQRSNEWIKKEHIAWRNLMEAMAYYLDYFYSAETYRAVPEEKNNRITGWLDYRRKSLDKEHEILSVKSVYSVPLEESRYSFNNPATHL